MHLNHFMAVIFDKKEEISKSEVLIQRKAHSIPFGRRQAENVQL